MSVYLASCTVTQFLQADHKCFIHSNLQLLHRIVIFLMRLALLRFTVRFVLHGNSFCLSFLSISPGIKPGRSLSFDLCSLFHGLHTHTNAHTKSHCSTLSVLLHSWLRGWDRNREIEGDGGGAKSSIIYGWNLISGRSLDGQRAYWQIDWVPVCCNVTSSLSSETQRWNMKIWI